MVCNKRTIESLVKAGAFDDLGTPAPGPGRGCTRTTSTPFVDVKRKEAIGQDSLFGGFGDDADGGDSVDFAVLPQIPTIEWDKQTLLAFEREMLGLYVSDHPLFGIEHVLTQHADTSIAALTGDEPQARRHQRHHRRADHRSADQADQEGRPLGDRHGRGPRRRHRVPVLPSAVRDRLARCCATTWSASCGAGSTGATTVPTIYAPGAHPPGHQGGPARPGRGDPAARPGHRRGRRADQGRARRAPGRHRGAPQAHPARPVGADAARRPAAGHRRHRRCSATSRRCSARPASAADRPAVPIPATRARSAPSAAPRRRPGRRVRPSSSCWPPPRRPAARRAATPPDPSTPAW